MTTAFKATPPAPAVATSPSSAHIRALIGKTQEKLTAARSVERQARFRMLVHAGLYAAGHPHAGRFQDATKQYAAAESEVRRLFDLTAGLTYAAEYAEWLEADAAQKNVAEQYVAARERCAQFTDCELLENRLAVAHTAARLGYESRNPVRVDDEMRSRLDEFHAARAQLQQVASTMEALTEQKSHAIRACSMVGDLSALVSPLSHENGAPHV